MPAGYSPAATMPTGAPMPAGYSPAPSCNPPPTMVPPYVTPAYGVVPVPSTETTEDQFVDVASEINYEELGRPTPPASEAGDCTLPSQSEQTLSQSEQSSPASTSKGSWKRPLLSENFGAEEEAKDAFPDDCPAPPGVGKCPAFSRFGGAHPLSPSQLGKEGFIGSVIKGTFINYPPPPPSPAHGTLSGGTARIRARSLPKDIGSPKSDFEIACHSLSYQHQPVSTPGSDGHSPTRNFNTMLTLANLTPLQGNEDGAGLPSCVPKRKGSRKRLQKTMLPDQAEEEDGEEATTTTVPTHPKRHSDPPRTDLRLSELL